MTSRYRPPLILLAPPPHPARRKDISLSDDLAVRFMLRRSGPTGQQIRRPIATHSTNALPPTSPHPQTVARIFSEIEKGEKVKWPCFNGEFKSTPVSRNQYVHLTREKKELNVKMQKHKDLFQE